MVDMSVHVSVVGLYRPPGFCTADPPQTIISVPVQTAEWRSRAEGAPVVCIGSHESETGSYIAPSPNWNPWGLPPPQMAILEPVHTAV